MERIVIGSTVTCNVCGAVIEPIKWNDINVECDCKRISVNRNNINYNDINDFSETIHYEYVSHDTLWEQFVEARKQYDNSLKHWCSSQKEKKS